ncbi:MAG TPA: hypothetical protein DCW51_15905 [Clostridium sp.]|nr:hypothetical protein [Clostridium sp.]
MIKTKKRSLYIVLVIILVVLGVGGYKLLPKNKEEDKFLSFEKENEIIENVELAKELLVEVETIKDKERVEENLDEVIKNENREISRKEAYNAVVKAGETMAQEDINSARYEIITLPEEIVQDRIRFNEILDKAQQTLMTSASEALDIAVNTMDSKDIDAAIKIYNDISKIEFNDGVKEWIHIELEPKLNKILNVSK